LRGSQVLHLLSQLLPRDAVVVEEAPSDRAELLARVPTRSPLGFHSSPNGGLGFGLAGAIGLRMAMPERPVVAVIGDGSAMFGIQAVWSAVEYDVGVLCIVMANGRYGVMDRQASARETTPPWPRFPGLQIAAMARAMGCAAVRVTTSADMASAVRQGVYDLRAKQRPLLIEVAVSEPESGCLRRC
jgi:benzoylformate decarboxylase